MKTTNKKNNEYCSCEGFNLKIQLGPYKCSKCGLLIPDEKMNEYFEWEAKQIKKYKKK